MAYIQITDFDQRSVDFHLAPLMPTRGAPRDSYLIEIRGPSDVVFSRQFSVHGWQLGHYYIYRLARSFQMTPGLFEAKLCLKEEKVGSYDPGAHLREGPGWLMVSIETARSKIGRCDPRVLVDFLIQPDFVKDGEQEDLLAQCLRLWGWCTPEAATDFGYELERECRSSESARKRLGLSAPDDGFFPITSARSRDTKTSESAGIDEEHL